MRAAGSGAAAARAVAPGIALPRPRPVRPVRTRPTVTRPRRVAPRRHDGLAPALLAASAAWVADHRLLDRLVRGRFWIGFVAFALLGIVALQLSLLKLNTGIGRALEHEAMLQRENASMQANISALSAGDRVEGVATGLGMVVAAPGAIRFLSAAGHGDALRAASGLTPPSSSSPAPAGALNSSGPAATGTTTQSGTAASGTTTQSGTAASGGTTTQSGSAASGGTTTQSGSAASGTTTQSGGASSGSTAQAGSASTGTVAPGVAGGASPGG